MKLTVVLDLADARDMGGFREKGNPAWAAQPCRTASLEVNGIHGARLDHLSTICPYSTSSARYQQTSCQTWGETEAQSAESVTDYFADTHQRFCRRVPADCTYRQAIIISFGQRPKLRRGPSGSELCANASPPLYQYAHAIESGSDP